MKKKRGIKIAVLVIVVILALIGLLLTFITDFLWFGEIGYVSVFFKRLVTELALGIPGFIILTLLTFVYLKLLKKNYIKKVNTVEFGINVKTLNRITFALSAVFGFITVLTYVNNCWFEVLKCFNATDFGKKDPIFHHDISFYVFKLDLLSKTSKMLLIFIIALMVLTLVYYLILLSSNRPRGFQDDEQAEYYDNGNFDDNPFGERKVKGIFGKFVNNGNAKNIFDKRIDRGNFKELMHIAGTQLAVLGVLFFLSVGFDFFLRQYDLLYSESGMLFGAGYRDIKVTLLIYRIIMVLSVFAAIGVVLFRKRKQYRKMMYVPIIMIAVGILGTAGGMVVQYWVVDPDELNKEGKYLEYSIAGTRDAYNLNDVTIKNFPASSTLIKEDIKNNPDTINNIRINDFGPAENFYNQTQSIRTYYAFNDVDVDRYMIDGEYTQTFLSARELEEEKTPQQWVNKYLKYTHGYGITLSRVDKVTSNGQPDMLIHNIPPVTDVKELKIKRPEIYFGELTNKYILTNTDEKEFDYPNSAENKDQQSNVYTEYKGKAGIRMNIFNRLIFAAKERSLKMLVSTNIDAESKIIINRNIEERVRKIMPFLEYDNDPYIVLADGKLYWIIDAYTKSNRYPYSQPYAEDSDANYIRNSVKVVVDAYNGDTNYYLTNDKDPIAKTYAKIYPKLFKKFDKMPKSLQKHVRYPKKLFEIQSVVYKKYHMDDVKVFYQSEDIWDIAKEIFGTDETYMTPQYYIIKLPGENKSEFISSIPYTPKGKNNMTGLLVARNDGEHYGKLILYRLPKGKTVYGPQQVEAQIDQDSNISKEFSLWNSSGSKYNRGNMFVIPIENGLLYVEPVYLEATNASLPEVKRVIVSYGNKIAYEPTLAGALNSLFGDGTVTGDAGSEPNKAGQPSQGNNENKMNNEDLAQKANDVFEEALNAQRNGDWATYGEKIKEVERYLHMMVESNQSGQTSDKPSNKEKDKEKK